MTLDLAHNTNPYGPAPGVLTALAELSAADLYEYPPSFTTGEPSLLAQTLAKLCAVPIERIILDGGAEGLLKGALHHLVRPGDRVALPSAAWSYYRDLIREVEGVAVEYPVTPFGDEYVVDIESLLALADTDVRVLLLASPANPTGNLFPLDRLSEVLTAFQQSTVIMDEAYLGLGDTPPVLDETPALTDAHPNLLVIRTFSKADSLAGMRIGYAIAGDGLTSFRRRTTRYLGYPRPAEVAALAALNDPDHREWVRRAIDADRHLITTTLTMFDGVTVYRSYANFVLVRFPRYMMTPIRTALTATDITVKWLSEPEFADCIRITIGTHEHVCAILRVLVRILARTNAPAVPHRGNMIPAYLRE
jgi:histidinol-phosphate aminotransferase